MPADTPPGPRHDRPRSGPPPIPFLPAEEEPTAVTLHVSEVTPASGGIPGGAGTTPVTGHTFDLLGEIARGGMGVVHRARDNTLGRDVAVKLLRDDFPPDSPVAHRFFDEARITGRLQHPGVPPVYQYGTLADGRPFLAMKLIEGRTLDDLLKARASPADDRGRFVAAFEQICQAVGYAHSQGVIHRDLKPANVMVGAFGEVQVMDWGIARGPKDEGGRMKEEPAPAGSSSSFILPPSSFTTSPGQVKGTPAYMAPEQAREQAVDARADVFALGGVLCSILTGKPPFARDNFHAAVLAAGSADLADAFGRLDSCGADPELVVLCKRCLAPNPGDRPADGRAVAEAVAAYRAAVEDRARTAEADRVAAEVRAAEERKRRRVQLALGAAVGLLLLGGGGFAWWQDHEAADRAAERQRAEGELEAAALRQRVEDERRAGDERTRVGRNTDALAALTGRCEDAIRGEDAEAARAALAEIDRRLPDGGVDSLADRIRRCRAELPLLQELDRIDRFRWTPNGGSLPEMEQVAERWRAALAAAGFDLHSHPPAEVAGRLKASLLRDRLLSVLDMLLAGERTGGVLAVLRVADPHPFRDEIRAALVVRDEQKMIELANRPEALDQPPEFTAVLGQLKPIPVARRRALLETAVRRWPGSLPLLIGIGSTYPFNQKEGAAERARWFQTALAAHPRNALVYDSLATALRDCGDRDGALACSRAAVEREPANHVFQANLGVKLSDLGDRAGAIARYREAIRLNPGYALAHGNLGAALLEMGHRDEAIAASREAVRLNPKEALAHNNLGLALAEAGDRDGAVASYREAIRLNSRLWQAHGNLGKELSEKGDRAGAITHLREAVKLSPTHPRSYYWLSQTLWETGDFPGAVAAMRELIRLDPKMSAAHARLGAMLAETGDRAGAIASLREAIRLDPESPRAHNALGVTLFFGGDHDAAAAHLRIAIKHAPKEPTTHYYLGETLWASKDFAGAVTCHREAIKLNPKYAEARVGLATALQSLGDLPGAVAGYRDALALNPRDARTHYNLGTALRDKGEPDAAAASFRDAIKIAPEYYSAHFSLGRLLDAKGDRDGAAACYRQMIKLKPSDAAAHYYLGRILDEKDELDGAAACYREAIKLDRGFAAAHYHLGELLWAQKDFPGAAVSLRAAVRLDPKAADFHTGLGTALLSLGDRGDAIACFREALGLDPKHWRAHYNLAVSLRDTGDLRGAAEHFRAAILLNPKDPDGPTNLGLVLADLGDLDGAIAAYRAALKIAPKDPFAKRSLDAALKVKAGGAKLPVAPPPRPVRR